MVHRKSSGKRIYGESMDDHCGDRAGRNLSVFYFKRSGQKEISFVIQKIVKSVKKALTDFDKCGILT